VIGEPTINSTTRPRQPSIFLQWSFESLQQLEHPQLRWFVCSGDVLHQLVSPHPGLGLDVTLQVLNGWTGLQLKLRSSSIWDDKERHKISTRKYIAYSFVS
jgi:hypothetical protein